MRATATHSGNEQGKRAGLYARYSDIIQNPVSIEDQLRICRELAERSGWVVVEEYADRAMTGTTRDRPELLRLVDDMAAGRIDIVVTEDLSRISRDQEDAAWFYKRAVFYRVRFHSVTEGLIGPLHIGLKGTMNALYISDMTFKVKRSQRGCVVDGRIAGGNCYGFDVVRRFDEHGKPVTGERTINEEQATIVRRIFRMFADGVSPKIIASRLNAEGVPGPRSAGWQASTIYGNRQRGAGILNNELYIGQQVYNKASYIRNPVTNGIVSRINPDHERVRGAMEHLRIVDQELWDAVKARQKRIADKPKKYWQHRRPTHLFSFLLKCGCCGGGYAKSSAARYGCSTYKNKGSAKCSNRLTIRQDELEFTVFGILKKHLMDEDLLKVFSEEYTAHINRLRMGHNASLGGYRAELAKLERRQAAIVRAVMEGFATEALKEESNRIDARQKELKFQLASEREAPVLLHPKMARRYQLAIRDAIRDYHDRAKTQEVIELLRGLVEKIVLTPNESNTDLLVSLHGDLAGILRLSTGKHHAGEQEPDFKQILLVANGGEQPQPRRRGRAATGGAATHGNPLHLLQSKMVGPAGLEPATRPL